MSPEAAALIAFLLVILWPSFYRRKRKEPRQPRITIIPPTAHPPRKD